MRYAILALAILATSCASSRTLTVYAPDGSVAQIAYRPGAGELVLPSGETLRGAFRRYPVFTGNPYLTYSDVAGEFIGDRGTRLSCQWRELDWPAHGGNGSCTDQAGRVWRVMF